MSGAELVGVLAIPIFIFLVVLFLVTLFLPFFVLRIRREIIELNVRADNLVTVLLCAFPETGLEFCPRCRRLIQGKENCEVCGQRLLKREPGRG